MATQAPNEFDFPRLHQLTFEGDSNSTYELTLFVENKEIELQKKDTRTWAPITRSYVSLTSQMSVEIVETRRRQFPFKKKTKETTSHDFNRQMLAYDRRTSTEHETIASKPIVVRDHEYTLKLHFSANATPESLHTLLGELKDLLEEQSASMSKPTKTAVDILFKYGAAVTGLHSIAKAVFSVAQVTYELLQEQKALDKVPPAVFKRMEGILPLAEAVDELTCDETEIFSKVVPPMFEVMQSTLKLLCDYVRRGALKRMFALKEKETIEKMCQELGDVIENFDRAVQLGSHLSVKRIEESLLFGRFTSRPASYHLDSCCKKDTRKSLLKGIMNWVNEKSAPGGVPESKIFWLYGFPGIGKTALAHSICEGLHGQGQLAGSFFCRGGNLSEQRTILPTLIRSLAEVLPAFRIIVAKRLRQDTYLAPETMNYSVFLDFIGSVPVRRHPSRNLAFVIDALDECGNTVARTDILGVLAEAATLAPWLKIVITSRPESDIELFFKSLSRSSYTQRNLATDREADGDLRYFAEYELGLVGKKKHCPMPWPEESILSEVVSRANGLFLFIKTLVLRLEKCEHPDRDLKAILETLAKKGLPPLYDLYSSILQALEVCRIPEFQRVIGVLLTTAPYRSLCDETIAKLAEVELIIVKNWVDGLSSLLYHDGEDYEGIRVRHLSISEFFVSEHCKHRVTLQDAHVLLGITCLKIMMRELHFNICKLEDSQLANARVENLEAQIKKHISDSLQYSCRYWSNHLCIIPNNGDQRVIDILKEFFEGVYPIFWIEVLSIMRMVPNGAPSLRRVISCVKDPGSTLVQRIEDVHRFIITFHTPISISAPHTYISTRPFLPSQSPLSTTFSRDFTKGIRVQTGKWLSWPDPPVKWIGHTGAVRCMRFSPDGYRIVTGCTSHTILIRDAVTGTVVGRPLIGHRKQVSSLAYSPDGRHIISGSDDNTIRIWDGETGDAVGRPLHTDFILFIAYSPDGQRIISGSGDNIIRSWDVNTGDVVARSLKGHTGRALSMACSPDGRYCASGFNRGVIIIWDVETGVAVGRPLKAYGGHVTSIGYSPDGCHIVAGCVNGASRIWDSNTFTGVGSPLPGHNGRVSSIAYSLDGRHILSSASDRVIIWDAKTSVIVFKLEARNTSVAYSPNGLRIASGYHSIIQIWDVETGAVVGRPSEGHNGRVRLVAYSADGQRIISCSEDGTIRIWSAETGAAISKSLEDRPGVPRPIACSHDGRYIASRSGSEAIQIWDTETSILVSRLLEGRASNVATLACSRNGQHVISGSYEGIIHIWDAKTGAAVGKPLEGHDDRVSSIDCSPDGLRITSGSWGKTIRIWDLGTGTMIGKPLTGHIYEVWCLANSPIPHSRRLISGSGDNTIRIWDANTCDIVGKPLTGHKDQVLSVAYSPDGQHIISGSYDKTIRIWDAETGEVFWKPLVGHGGPVYSIACSPDGEHIISGSEDEAIHVWNRFPLIIIQTFPHNPINEPFCAQPGTDGWVKNSEGGLLYWVPPDYRTGLHSPALLTIPPTSHSRSVSLDFDGVALGESWTQIYSGAQR